MNMTEYRALAMRTSPNKGDDQIENGIFGLIGETGELADVIKKWRFQSGTDATLPREKIIDEAGDVLWYCVEFSMGKEEEIPCPDAMWDGRLLHLLDNEKPFPIQEALRFGILRVNCAVAGLSANSLGEDDIICATQSFGKYIGTILYYIGVILYICDSTLSEAAERNIAKLRARYPDGFDPDRSMNRAEYQKAEARPGQGS